jgi:hypothetical protein
MNSDRRNFLKDAAAVGILGAAGMASGLVQPTKAVAQAAVQVPQGAGAGTSPGPQVDCRAPVSFENSLPEGMRILTQYFSALNRRDQRAMTQAFHYPFVTYEGIDTVIVESADQLLSSPPPSLNVTGKGQNKIRPASYDILDRMELLLYGPCGAGFSLDYSRYREDGHKLFGVYGIYGVTNNDGKWGIEYMSTIFRPADQIHTTWDAQAFDLRSVHDTYRVHDLGRKYNQPTHSLAPGKWGSVSLAAGSTKFEGVKSRLHVREITSEQVENPSQADMQSMKQNQERFRQYSGGGLGKWYQSLEIPNARVLAADMEKAHAVDGFRRYTEDGTLVSEAVFMTALLFRNNFWQPVDGPAMFCCSLVQNLGTGPVYM